MLKNENAEPVDFQSTREEFRGVVRGVKRKKLAPCRKPPVVKEEQPRRVIAFYNEVHRNVELRIGRGVTRDLDDNNLLPGTGRAAASRMVVNFWTAERDRKLIQMRESGATWSAIGAEMGKTTNAVKVRYYKIQRNGAAARWTDAERAQVREMRSTGKTVAEIADKTGRSKQAIRKMLQRCGNE